MLKNYFKVSWRNLLKYKVFSIINITGLAIGMAFALLICAFVWEELQVNQDLRNVDQQFIIQSNWKNPNLGIEFTTLGPLAKSLHENYPHLVKNYYRFDAISSNISKGNQVFREGLQIGDSTLLTMFGFDLVSGDPHTALSRPYSMVITTKIAQKYFDRANVVGESLTVENFSGERRDFLITGVLEKNSQNSVTYFSKSNDNHIFIPDNTLEFFGRDIEQWSNPYVLAFIELADGKTPADLEAPMLQIIAENTSDLVQQNLNPYLISLKEFYLNANQGSVRKLLFTLGGVAVFILLMAVVNFVNITISKARERMREIGVRKVLGGMKIELRTQFYMESLVLVFLSGVLSLIIYYWVEPFFGLIVGKPIMRISEFPGLFMGLALLGMLVLGLVAGTYPAMVLSSIQEVKILDGKLTTGRVNTWFRKGLIAFQFFIAAVVIIAAFIVSAQVQYFFNKDLGYEKAYIISAQVPREWSSEGVDRMLSVRNQFAQLPEVKVVSLGYQIPDGSNPGQSAIYKIGTDSSLAKPTELLYADESYAATYQIPMMAGQFFSENGNIQDTTGIVINESQALALGWTNPSDAINSKLRLVNNSQVFTVKGVIRDYHFGSLHQAIRPAVFFHVRSVNLYRYLSFKLDSENINESLTKLEQKWASLLPGAPFEYTFMDETLTKLYSQEIQLQNAAYTATTLAIIIAFLGVFGLVAISIQQRKREIGIRKVIGASVLKVQLLFLRDFLPIVLLAGLLAIPLTAWIMQHWLNQYEYGVNISMAPFILTVGTLGISTGLLILVQTLKVALTNPAEALEGD